MTWPKAVLFDLDGTLIDSAPSVARALNAIITERHGEPVSEQKVRSLISRGAPALVAESLGHCATSPEQDLAEFRTLYGGMEPDPGHLYPGAVALLGQLRRADIRLGICTNKPQTLTENVLGGLGLAAHFAAVLGGDATPNPKPHPGHLQAALSKMGVRASDAAYVGDSEIDAEAAEKAGICFVLADYGYALGPREAIRCQARLAALAHLPGLLTGLERARP